MKRLLLADNLFDELDNGKKVTIRKGKRDIGPGHLIFESVSDGREKLVNVTRVYVCRLSDVSPEDYRNDGFSDMQDMVDQMRQFYADITHQSIVTVIKFHIEEV